MNRTQLEAFVLAAVDRILAGNKIEDARVELKKEWLPDTRKVARRLAGHCNAARAAWVVWIIGVDEHGAWRQDAEPETHEWVDGVLKHFDGVAPSLVLDLKIPVGEHVVTALMFDAQRAPYVWRARGEEIEGVEAVTLEVPWREGTRVRSARREDIFRLFSPSARPPQLELVSGYFRLYGPNAHPFRYRLVGQLEVFITPPAGERVVLPIYKMRGALIRNATEWGVSIGLGANGVVGGADHNGLVVTTLREAIVSGPGHCAFEVFTREAVEIPKDATELEFWLFWTVAGDTETYQFDCRFAQLPEDTDKDRWTAFQPEDRQ
jgi:hypothetical protein